jgi:hypothetical protein
MPNTLLTPNIITKESLMILENQLVMAKKVNRAYENQKNPNTTFKRGDTINVRKPNRFTVSTGAALDIQDVTETSVAVVVNVQDHVDFNFTTKDLTLTIEEFSERYIHPAMAALANKIDLTTWQLYKDIYNQVGTPGTTPNSFLSVANVNRRLNEEACPKDANRTLVIDPGAEVSLTDAFKALFNPNRAIGDQYEEAKLGRVAGLDIFMDQNVGLHTSGTQDNTTPLVNDTYAAGETTISIDGGDANATLKKGDTFTIASVFAVNPQSRQSTGVLRQIVVTADNTASAGGAFTDVAISPAMFASGALQNVTALPADNAVVTLFNPAVGGVGQTAVQNLGFHRDAFTLVTVPLELPQGVHFAARESYKGINLRLVRQYRIATDDIPTRIDILYGVKTIYPELACRLAG